MNYSHWLMNEGANAMGWALVHSVWQGAAAWFVLAVMLRLLRQVSAGVRYGLACTSLGLVAISFGTTVYLHWPERRLAAPSQPLALVQPIHELEAPEIEVVELALREVWTLEGMLPWVVAGWLIGVIVFSLWQFGGWMLLRRYRRTALPVDVVWSGRLSGVARLIGVKRVEMAITQRLDVPIVIGVIRPYILMPAAVLANLPVPQIEAILAHELAHIRRNDYLVNLIQSVIETIFFYHPAVWWISTQIRREREFACDEIAASVCGNRAMYAKALAALEESRAIKLVPAAGGGGRGELVERVRRVLGLREVRKQAAWHRRSWTTVAFLLSTVLAIGLWSRRLTAQPAQSAPTTAPTTQSSISPDDLVPPPARDYVIGPNDLVQVKIGDLIGPGIETVATSRVSADTGIITLPLIGEVKAAGLTEAELVREIVQSYRNHNLIRNAMVNVTVLEARGRLFSVLGAVRNPGQFAIIDQNFRLSDALVLARGTTAIADIRVIRPTADPSSPRLMEIPAADVAEGNPRTNIVIRPGDTVVVVPSARQTAATMTPAEEAELHETLKRGVVTAEAAWASLKQRQEAGEAMTPAFVQLRLDAARRVYDAKVAATDDPRVRLTAAEEQLQRVAQLTEMLRNRLGQDVTTVQISQGDAMLDAARAEVLRRRADARGAAPTTEPATAPAGRSAISVHVVVDARGLSQQGRSTEWAAIRKSIETMRPEFRERGISIELLAASGDVSMKRMIEVQLEARKLVDELGLLGVQIRGVYEPDYYLGGHVRRSGVYSIPERGVTLREAIGFAGGLEPGASHVSIARIVDGRYQDVLRSVELGPILDGSAPDVALQPHDEIMVHRGAPPVPPPANAPATQPAAATPGVEISGAEVAARNPGIKVVIRPGDGIVAVQPEAPTTGPAAGDPIGGAPSAALESTQRLGAISPVLWNAKIKTVEQRVRFGPAHPLTKQAEARENVLQQMYDDAARQASPDTRFEIVVKELEFLSRKHVEAELASLDLTNSFGLDHSNTLAAKRNQEALSNL